MRTFTSLLVASVWMLGAGVGNAHSSGEIGQRTEIHALGTAEAILTLSHDAVLETRQSAPGVHEMDGGPPWDTAAIPPWGRASQNDLSIESTADSVAVVIEEVGVPNPLRLAFVSHRTRAYGCTGSFCTRFEVDHVMGRTPASVCDDYPPQAGISLCPSTDLDIHSLPAGQYTFAVIAPPGAVTTAVLELAEPDDLPASRSATLAESNRGSLQAWHRDAFEAGPESGSLSGEMPGPGHSTHDYLYFQTFGQKADPDKPGLTFGGYSGGRTGPGMNSGRRYRYHPRAGTVTFEWDINLTSNDRRAVVAALLWW